MSIFTICGLITKAIKEKRVDTLEFILDHVDDELDEHASEYSNEVRKSIMSAAFNSKNLEIIKCIFSSSSFSISDEYYGGWTPLHYAINSGNVDVIKYVLDHGADVFAESEEDDIETPLEMILFSDDDRLKEFIPSFVNENAYRIGGGILCRAVENDRIDLLKLLLEHGANVNAKGYRGKTLLDCACAKGNIELVKFLIKKGVNVNTEPEDDSMPLDIALRKGFIDIAELLIKHGAAITRNRDTYKYSIIDAMEIGNIKSVKILLDYYDKEIHYDILDHPLLQAVCWNNTEAVKLLLEHGANANHDSGKWNSYMTGLHYACEKGNIEIVKLLLEHGAYVNARSSGDWTPLHFAADSGHVEIIKTLLDHNADINAKNKYVDTPLQLAIDSDHVEIAEYLLEHGADINAKNDRNETPLLHAYDKENIEIIKLLLEHGAKMNIKNKYKDTPLHTAIKHKKIKVVKYLLEHCIA